MNRTKIEWVKNPYWEWTDDTGKIHISGGEQGYTWNPITGCLNHINGLCNGGNFPCYAYRLATTRLKERYLANLNIATQPETTGNPFRDPFYPRFWPERVEAPVHNFRFHRWAERQRYRDRGIFVCDMGELFGDWIPLEWQERIFETIKQCPNDRFYLLTKQPQNLIKFSPFPDNCWVGVTVTKPELFFPALDALDSIQCSIRYLSIEPMLAAFDVPDLSLHLEGSVDRLIIGAQTRPYKPPKIEWVEEIVRAADQAGIPVFLKDNLKPLMLSELFSTKQWAWSGNKLRQEMPG